MNLPVKSLLVAFVALYCFGAQAGENSFFGGEYQYFSYKIDGKVRLRSEQFDDLYVQNGGARTDTYLRRGDLGVSGAIAGKLDYEWAGRINAEQEWSVKTFSLGFAPTKKTYLKFGRFDADFGLEMSSSSNWSLGVERSSIWDLSPDAGEVEEGWGASASHHSPFTHVSLGHFEREQQSQYTLRAVLKPLHKKRHLLHVGYSYADAYDATNEGRIRTNLGVYAAQHHPDGNRTQLAKKVDDGEFSADKTGVAEFAYLLGPFSVQAEQLRRTLEGHPSLFNRHARGRYLQIAFSLTGEARNYDEDQAVFSRLKAKNKKIGALEVFARTEHLSISGETGMLSKKRNHSSAQIQTLGMNWYPGDSWRLTLNASRGTSEEVPNEADETQGNALSVQVLYRFGG